MTAADFGWALHILGRVVLLVWLVSTVAFVAYCLFVDWADR